MKREAAVLFADALREAGVEVDEAEVDRIHAEMVYLNDVGSAAREVQRWHEEAGHPVAGSRRCPECKR